MIRIARSITFSLLPQSSLLRSGFSEKAEVKKKSYIMP